MEIRWHNKCYMCSAPLDFSANIPGEYLRAFYTYSKFKPINFVTNMSYVKIIGLNQRRLCLKCFSYKKCKQLPGPKKLFMRETGQIKDLMTHGRSPLTTQDVYEWFKDFDEFAKRKDLEQYLVKDAKFSMPGLTVLIWSHSLQYLQFLLDH